MTSVTYRGVRFNVITVDEFWRVMVGQVRLPLRWRTYPAAWNYATEYIDLHYKELVK
jgi:hypothetical protein